jgi:hypothetical protein
MCYYHKDVEYYSRAARDAAAAADARQMLEQKQQARREAEEARRVEEARREAERQRQEQIRLAEEARREVARRAEEAERQRIEAIRQSGLQALQQHIQGQKSEIAIVQSLPQVSQVHNQDWMKQQFAMMQQVNNIEQARKASFVAMTTNQYYNVMQRDAVSLLTKVAENYETTETGLVVRKNTNGEVFVKDVTTEFLLEDQQLISHNVIENTQKWWLNSLGEELSCNEMQEEVEEYLWEGKGEDKERRQENFRCRSQVAPFINHLMYKYDLVGA